jgi:hypothetical protein
VSAIPSPSALAKSGNAVDRMTRCIANEDGLKLAAESFGGLLGESGAKKRLGLVYGLSG